MQNSKIRLAFATMSTAVLVSNFAFADGASKPSPKGSSPLADCPEDLPQQLVPAADQRFKFKRAASGVQIYVCSVNKEGDKTWLFIAPQANLSGANGKLSGTHSIGPIWQGNDGSFVKGSQLAEAAVDPTSIPWLLLKGEANTAAGRYQGITSIQRLNTVGGIAPDAAGCNDTSLGTITQVPYTADYYFYDTQTPPAEGNRQCR